MTILLFQIEEKVFPLKRTEESLGITQLNRRRGVIQVVKREISV